MCRRNSLHHILYVTYSSIPIIYRFLGSYRLRGSCWLLSDILTDRWRLHLVPLVVNLKSEKSKNPRENREFQRSIVENIETQSTNYSEIIDRLFTVCVSDRKTWKLVFGLIQILCSIRLQKYIFPNCSFMFIITSAQSVPFQRLYTLLLAKYCTAGEYEARWDASKLSPCSTGHRLICTLPSVLVTLGWTRVYRIHAMDELFCHWTSNFYNNFFNNIL